MTDKAIVKSMVVGIVIDLDNPSSCNKCEFTKYEHSKGRCCLMSYPIETKDKGKTFTRCKVCVDFFGNGV